MLNVPNTLTLLRIVAIPAILIALDNGRFGLAFALFIAAGVTDGLDGGIARMTNTRTDLGAYLDPLADKGLVVSLLIKLTLLGMVPGWVLTIILTRDIVCITGYALLFFLTGERIEVRPSLVGKLATVLQLAGVATSLLVLYEPSTDGAIPQEAIFAAAASATAVAGVQYVARGLAWYQARPA
ncbi:MAG TPA: CDP-alcohol phosphatidyltransferase family protein [Candidatus Binatia bacterium]|nr:CDP-alcohol phosphatidyltransferase family protein [Candidatus Binatia bacterium]